jgi:hypothetical protein
VLGETDMAVFDSDAEVNLDSDELAADATSNSHRK